MCRQQELLLGGLEHEPPGAVALVDLNGAAAPELIFATFGRGVHVGWESFCRHGKRESVGWPWNAMFADLDHEQAAIPRDAFATVGLAEGAIHFDESFGQRL